MLESGTSLSGTTSGAAVGVVVGGPAGAILGAGAGWAVERVMRVGGEYAQRHLAPREETRVGAILLLVYNEISARLIAGEVPREDLRSEITPGRSPAEELAEATLRAAADTHEERKLPYLAHLLAAIPFEPDLTHAHANQLIAVADQLAYRQLVGLAVYADVSDRARYEFWGERSQYEEEGSELLSLRVDLLDLFRRGLVRVRKRSKQVGREEEQSSGQRRGLRSFTSTRYVDEDLPWPAIPREINPREIQLSVEGERLVRMMRLDEVPSDDREDLVLALLRHDRFLAPTNF